MRAQPTLRISAPYYDDATYIDALAQSARDSIGALSAPPEKIIASFHGMPQEYVDKGDPYFAHCVRTTELLRASLNMSADQLLMTFQSRFGPSEWLKPYTDETIARLAQEGVRRIAVLTPGFAADCLETLEEIAQENIPPLILQPVVALRPLRERARWWGAGDGYFFSCFHKQ